MYNERFHFYCNGTETEVITAMLITRFHSIQFSSRATETGQSSAAVVQLRAIHFLMIFYCSEIPSSATFYDKKRYFSDREPKLCRFAAKPALFARSNSRERESEQRASHPKPK